MSILLAQTPQAGVAAKHQKPANSSDSNANAHPAPGSQIPAHVRELTESLKNPVNRLAYLQQLAKACRKARELGDMSTAVLARLPDTAFSELLRSLDPLDSFSKELDPTAGMHVGPGMARLTPIGNEFDVWGVRKRYVTLLNQALAASQLRREAGRPLLLSDYKVLLRCAGAASDLESVRLVWGMMEETGYREFDPETYLELVRARFLTEPLYTQYDLARFRVTPINLHLQKVWLMGRKQRHYLRILGHNRLRRQRHAFGHNRQSLNHAEHLARILRKHRPPYLLFRAVVRKCYIVDERALCALMVAFARSGSMRHFEELILKHFWGVEVKRRAGAQARVAVQAIAYAADSPLRPSGRLLEAIVTSYCLNAEVATALKVLDAVSRCYSIPISDKVWFDLLEWAYILCSKPVATEWKVVNRQFRGTKVIRQKAVQMIWETMTAEPYNVRPGFHQYQLLTSALIAQGHAARALDLMLELEPMYRGFCEQLERAFCKHALSTALGVRVARSEKAWRQARARKHAAWYKLQLMCRSLLKKACKGKAGEHTTLRGVPQFVEAFRDLLPANVRYPIRTGEVELHDAAPVRRLEWTTATFTRLPRATGDAKIGGKLTRLKKEKVEEKRLVAAPHVSLHGFLSQRRPSWVLVQREFR